jgi:hypothetical protein
VSATAGTEQQDGGSVEEISWDDLFEFQKNYRLQHQITATAFLRQLRMPGTLLHYLYSKEKHPSKKPLSLGGKFRTAIINFRNQPPLSGMTNNPSDLVDEYFRNHESMFLEQNIFAVNVGCEGDLEIYSEKVVDTCKVRELFAELDLESNGHRIDGTHHGECILPCCKI